MTAQRAVPHLENQSKYSAYRMIVFSCFSGGITVGQETGQMAAGSTWRHDIRRILKKDRSPGLDHLQAGTVHPEHHVGAFGCGFEEAEIFLAGGVRR